MTDKLTVLLGPGIRPTIERNVPRCDVACSSHDGKRCAILGGRPEAICEPALRLLPPIDWRRQ